MKTTIGIVGSGIGSVHLGLFLLKQGVSTTIYSDRSPDQLRDGRLPNTVALLGATREREKALGVNYWDEPDFGVFGVNVYVGGEHPLSFRGEFERPGLFVDMRLYLPRLLAEFEARGGQIVFGALSADDVVALSAKHPLVVVASGRGSLTDLFPRWPEHSPYSQPQRSLMAGLFRGIDYPSPLGLTFNIAPGHGEIFENQMISFEGRQSGLLIEAIPGGDLEILTQLRYEDDPDRFKAALLERLHQYAPATYERIDPDNFALTRPLDILQGAVTPTVRRAYQALENDVFALAIGDVHVVNDPVTGQGANAASHAAWVAGDAIVETLEKGRPCAKRSLARENLSDFPLDLAFYQIVEKRMWAYTRYVTEWTNGMLQPPPPHAIDLLVAATQNKAIADAFVDNFDAPQRNWEIFSSPERMNTFLHSFAGEESPATLTAAV